MVTDMSIADVVILIVIALGLYHFATKKKARKDGPPIKQNPSASSGNDRKESMKESAPVIKVVFQVENTEEEDLVREIADMFLEERTYYYSGKKPQEPDHEEKADSVEMDKFVRFDDVQWDLIKTIEV